MSAKTVKKKETQKEPEISSVSDASRARFIDARNRVVLGDFKLEGIGCLAEKTTHAVIKLYLEPDTSYHERVVCGRMVADVQNEVGIFEIQTASFKYLNKKLEKFFEYDDVTVVYPCVSTKWVIWVDKNGTVSKRNRCPKKGSPANVFWELYQIKKHLKNPKFRLLVLMIDVDEYKLLSEKGNGKKGAKRFDRVPVGLVGEYIIREAKDYLTLLPPLPDKFTATDMARLTHLTAQRGWGIVSVLLELDLVEVAEKKGRSTYYRLKSE